MHSPLERHEGHTVALCQALRSPRVHLAELNLPHPARSEELEGVEGPGPPESPSSASLSADLGDLFDFWKLLFSFFSFIHCYFYFLTLLGALGLHCCAQAFSSCSAKGRLSGMAYRPPTAAAPLVVDHRLQVHGLQWLQLAGLIALRHVGSFQTPEKIEPHPLHWQANSFPLYIREVPSSYCFLLSKRAITISTPQITVMVKKLS